jgi:two-component system, OmpR family, KDP operon response regulator KdpE
LFDFDRALSRQLGDGEKKAMTATILIIEDDKQLAKLLRMELEVNGYTVQHADNGIDGIRMFKDTSPSLVVLDISLPIMDGLTVCQRLREFTDIPILMMTARAVTENDIAEGLNMGADEFMLKPLSNIEFHARVNALLRRARLVENATTKKHITSYDDAYLFVDINARRVRVNSDDVRLTPTEFKLLAMFIQHQGEVLTFQQLLENVWGTEYKNEHHYPRIYVSHLRRKIEPDVKYPTYIHNEYGVGYRFVGKSDAIRQES